MTKADYTLKLIEMMVKVILNKDTMTEDQFIAEMNHIAETAYTLRS